MSILSTVLICILFTAMGSCITILFMISHLRKIVDSMTESVDEKIKISETITTDIFCDKINEFANNIAIIDNELIKNTDKLLHDSKTLKVWLYNAVARIKRGENIDRSEICDPIEDITKEINPFGIIEDHDDEPIFSGESILYTDAEPISSVEDDVEDDIEDDVEDYICNTESDV